MLQTSTGKSECRLHMARWRPRSAFGRRELQQARPSVCCSCRRCRRRRAEVCSFVSANGGPARRRRRLCEKQPRTENPATDFAQPCAFLCSLRLNGNGERTAKNLGLNAFLRWKTILSGETPRDYDGHLKRWLAIAKRLHLDQQITDDISPRPNWERNFVISDSTDGAPATDYDVICYTDGSKMDEKVGWGVLVGTSASRFIENSSLVSSATVYQAELHAIFKACGFIADLPGERVIIHTDNSAALWALKARLITSSTVVVCRDALNGIGATRQVTLKWIKAHAGHLGNEIADAAAKHGCDIALCETTPVANQIIKAKAKAHYDNLWEERWKQRSDCRQTKLWFPSVNADSRAKSKSLLSLPRESLSTAIQFITGFNRLYKHQKVCDRTEDIDSTCRLCLEEDESAWHVVAECPAVCQFRTSAFGAPFLTTTSPWTPKQLVRFIAMLKEGTDIE